MREDFSMTVFGCTSRRECREPDPPGGREVLESHVAALRGTVIGPRGPLFPGSEMDALYVTASAYAPVLVGRRRGSRRRSDLLVIRGPFRPEDRPQRRPAELPAAVGDRDHVGHEDVDDPAQVPGVERDGQAGDDPARAQSGRRAPEAAGGDMRLRAVRDLPYRCRRLPDGVRGLDAVPGRGGPADRAGLDPLDAAPAPPR
jgi:hypothetical protein